MTDNEILNQILEKVSNLEKSTNDRFDKIEGRLDKMDNRLDLIELKQDRTSKKLDDLQLDVKIAERDIRRDIHTLKDEMETVIEVLKLNEMIPR